MMNPTNNPIETIEHASMTLRCFNELLATHNNGAVLDMGIDRFLYTLEQIIEQEADKLQQVADVLFAEEENANNAVD